MQFPMVATHSQINVFDDVEPDFNAWTDAHVAQGFAWRPHHVSFGLPDHDGSIIVDADVVSAAPVADEGTLRMIEVPFSAVSTVFAATTVEDVPIEVPPGDYALFFQLLKSDGRRTAEGDAYAYAVRFSFLKSDGAEFRILRHDGEMQGEVTTRTAEPAI